MMAQFMPCNFPILIYPLEDYFSGCKVLRPLKYNLLEYHFECAAAIWFEKVLITTM